MGIPSLRTATIVGNRSRAGKDTVILSAANLVHAAQPREILRCAQNDSHPVNGYNSCCVSLLLFVAFCEDYTIQGARAARERRPLASSSPMNSSLAGSNLSFRLSIHDNAAA
jgi:hypothetical protein